MHRFVASLDYQGIIVEKYIFQVNPLVPNALFLYPLKTSGNRKIF